jgi:hypothetical protein
MVINLPECSNIIKNEKVLRIIKERLIIRKSQKADAGEVFTPVDLICDALDKLPQLVWKNPNLKWFDPANGIGNFPIIVYYKLMEGLKYVKGYEKEEIRSKHIIETMLYMNELDKTNTDVCRQLFNSIDANAKPNMSTNDFINKENNWKNIFGFDKFDIIIGNPPYNSDGIKHKGAKNIYVSFSIKGFELLNKDGYLLYIHPPTYRIPNHKIQHARINLNEVYTNKNIICIKMFTIEDTKHLMNVMINIDYIIIQNSDRNEGKESTIIDVKGKVYNQVIFPNVFIPNYGLTILNKLINISVKNGKVDLLLTSEMHAQIISKTKINIHEPKYKNIHGLTSKGVKICYSNKPHSYQGKRKLIINGIGSYNYVFYDVKGEYGFTQSPLAIIEPTLNTLQLIESKLFHYIAGATKIIGNNFNIQTSLFLPIIPSEIKIQNDKDLYKYFNFSSEEIEEIEKYTIPEYVKCELLCKEK